MQIRKSIEMESPSARVVARGGEEGTIIAGVVAGDPRESTTVSDAVVAFGPEDDLAGGREGGEERERQEERRGPHVCREECCRSSFFL